STTVTAAPRAAAVVANWTPADPPPITRKRGPLCSWTVTDHQGNERRPPIHYPIRRTSGSAVPRRYKNLSRSCGRLLRRPVLESILYPGGTAEPEVRSSAVGVEDGAQGAGDLADGGAGGQGVLHHVEQVVVAPGSDHDPFEKRCQ